jgi:4-hydroxybenzoate polyprenyltransferase
MATATNERNTASPEQRSGLIAVLRLLRVKQWTKNLLVFAAPLFTNSLTDPTLLTRTLLAFATMCLISSAIYVLNDLRDAPKDRLHPVKRRRPIASGAIAPATAAGIGLACLIGGLALTFALGLKVAVVIGVYVVLQLLYNGGAKNIAILDVFLIGTGFVLRAALGAAAIDVLMSGWLLLCTGALALLLGFAKRRHEFILQGEQRTASRASLGHYTRPALDALVVMTACAAALCYGIYALESPTARQFPALILTAPFVFYGICRYVLLVFSLDEGGEPETILFKDPHMIASLVFFIAAAMLAVSGVELPLVERPPLAPVPGGPS